MKIASETDVRRDAALESAVHPPRDKNTNRRVKEAAGDVPDGRRIGATTRTAKKIPARPAVRDSRFRAHRTAAILLRYEDAGGNSVPTYADVMRIARGKISLEELEISNTRIRKAQAGGLLIEIPGGEEAGAKAEALVDRLKTVLAESEFGEKVSVIRPVQRAEVRLIDVDQSATVEEVVAAVSTCGKVPAASIRTGPFRQGRGGLNHLDPVSAIESKLIAQQRQAESRVDDGEGCPTSKEEVTMLPVSCGGTHQSQLPKFR